MFIRPCALVLGVVIVACGIAGLTGCSGNKVEATGPQITAPDSGTTNLAKLRPTNIPAGPPGSPGNPVGGTTGTSTGSGAVADATTAGPVTGGRIHTAEPKDTYYSLAVKYYGDGKKWQKIQDANPTIPANKIPLGARILIPD